MNEHDDDCGFDDAADAGHGNNNPFSITEVKLEPCGPTREQVALEVLKQYPHRFNVPYSDKEDRLIGAAQDVLIEFLAKK